MGIPHVPSEPTMKSIVERLQRLCGIKTYRCQGALGHIYFANDLLRLIGQVCL